MEVRPMNNTQMMIAVIVGYEQPMALPHRWNARRKHLGVKSFDQADLGQMTAYLSYLIDKSGKALSKSKSNESQGKQTNSKIKNLEVRENA
jgi:hypothetical protein